VVMPAVTIEATAIRVILSMLSPLVVVAVGSTVRLGIGFRFHLLCSCRGGNIHRGQDTENIGLNHPGKQAEQIHDDGKDKGCDS
jgi:hypothetical protein